MRCDLCNRDVNAVLATRDAIGRVVEIVCIECAEAIRIGRERLGLDRQRPLIDVFEEHLARIFPPVTIH